MNKNLTFVGTVSVTILVCACLLWMLSVLHTNNNNPARSKASGNLASEPSPSSVVGLQNRLTTLAAPGFPNTSSRRPESKADSDASCGLESLPPGPQPSIQSGDLNKGFVRNSDTASLVSHSPKSSATKHFAASLGHYTNLPRDSTPFLSAVQSPEPQLSRERASEAHQPVIFTDPGSLLPADPARDAALQSQAEELVEQINAAGLDHDSPEYLEHWNRLTEQSDQLLRQRYGGRVWTAHHIQAHHLSAASGNQTP